jgi:hypothetical protein
MCLSFSYFFLIFLSLGPFPLHIIIGFRKEKVLEEEMERQSKDQQHITIPSSTSRNRPWTTDDTFSRRRHTVGPREPVSGCYGIGYVVGHWFLRYVSSVSVFLFYLFIIPFS